MTPTPTPTPGPIDFSNGTVVTIATAIGALVTNGIACAVAFGVNLSSTEQTALLALVGTITTLGTVVVGIIENSKVTNAGKVAVANVGAEALVKRAS